MFKLYREGKEYSQSNNYPASLVSFDNRESNLKSDTVQDVIEEYETTINNLNSTIDSLNNTINNITQECEKLKELHNTELKFSWERTTTLREFITWLVSISDNRHEGIINIRRSGTNPPTSDSPNGEYPLFGTDGNFIGRFWSDGSGNFVPLIRDHWSEKTWVGHYRTYTDNGNENYNFALYKVNVDNTNVTDGMVMD